MAVAEIKRPSFLSLMASSVAGAFKGGFVGGAFGALAGLAIGGLLGLATAGFAPLLLGTAMGAATMSVVGAASGSLTGIVNKSREGMIPAEHAAAAVKATHEKSYAMGIQHGQEKENDNWRKYEEARMAERSKAPDPAKPPLPNHR